MWSLPHSKFSNSYEAMKDRSSLYIYQLFKNRFMEKDVMKGRVMEQTVGVVLSQLWVIFLVVTSKVYRFQ